MIKSTEIDWNSIKLAVEALLMTDSTRLDIGKNKCSIYKVGNILRIDIKDNQ